MKAIRVNQVGGPEVLSLEDVPALRATETHAVVSNTFAGINYVDTYNRTGYYPIPTPFTPGVEGIGTIKELATGIATDLKVGDRVGWVLSIGSYAQETLVPQEKLIPIPSDLSDQEALALLVQGLTAHFLATDTYPVKAGDFTVVHAGAGGVGLLLTRLIKSIGGKVLATASTEEKRELCRKNGADFVASYEDFPEVAKNLTSGLGADVIFDGVGKSTFDGDLASAKVRGTLVIFGGASGPVRPIDVMELERSGSLYLTRPTLRHYVATPAELRSRSADVFRLFKEGVFTSTIGGIYSLEDAAQAHIDLQARKTVGKILLKITN